MQRISRAVASVFAGACALAAASLHSQDFKKQVIYQVVTDRFYDGDTSNDNPAESPGLFDSSHTQWQAYWGGDLAGIQQKLSYIKGMGATAVWVSPVVNNENLNCTSSGVSAPYHAYWNRDFMNIEEHFGDNSNSFAAFDNLVSALHSNGMKIIVDQANNHSNPDNCGEYGSLYNNGTFLAAANNDPSGLFHHNPNISDYNDRYQVQYYTLDDLSDLNQESATIDGYLKSAATQLQNHHVDAFRLDAIKHVTWGWEYSFANAIFNNAPSFLYGEWMQANTSDPLYADSYKFANLSGINLLDFPLNTALRDVFANDSNFSEIDSTINAENASFTFPNDLVTFFDSHDQPRLLSLNDNQNRLQEATAFLLTGRGIPILFYGDEQYLFNNSNGGNDPYNRVWMSSFNTETTAYKIIGKLAGLRAANDAVGYGTWKQRWMNNDVYIYERQFFNDVVLVAVNKNDATPYPISGLHTALPPGTYSDYLGGLQGGNSLTVAAGAGGNNPASNYTIAPASVSVWQYQVNATMPEVGSIGPHVGQPGMTVTIAGDGFGSLQGSVLFGPTAATIKSWSNTQVTFTVPGVAAGAYNVQLKNSSGSAANTIAFTALTAKQIPVTFTVNNANPTNPGDYIFVTGNAVELGNWGTTFQTAVGPMLDPHYPNWFLNVALPAGQTVQFKFIDVQANGNVIWENGSNHPYTVPTSGTGNVNVNWQY
ncbi:MAG TPA: alpha-amylase family glycosyl hydrolase [Terracidiphilus sp.]|jgi:glycosidase|nr:alpha-amylase family glycosyl hydrolase [Terracidiphilus sp.]